MSSKNGEKRVLIVDDQVTVAEMLAENLRRLGRKYVIDTAHSADEALARIASDRYALVVTDHRMKGMNGLDLAHEIYKASSSTKVILMTAYGTTELRKAAQNAGITNYLDKPFKMQQIREIVKQAVENTRREEPSEIPQPEDETMETIHEELESLHVNCQARSVLLLGRDGYTIETAGQTSALDTANISSLVAANFVAAAELAKLLSTGSIFKSSYHEGTDYNIYSYDINGEYLLAVIFGAESKPGTVWFYTKQAVTALKPLLDNLGEPTGFSKDMSEQMSRELDAQLTDAFGEFEDFDAEDEPDSLLSLEEAVSAGLVPSEWNDSSEQQSS